MIAKSAQFQARLHVVGRKDPPTFVGILSGRIG